jgi:endonuclease YncB( thermonuclease family)
MIFVSLLVAVCAAAASAQASLAGKVVEVVDGRTLIVETGAGMITAQLQYIETPEPEQPMRREVTAHLSKLAVGRDVEFKPLRIFSGKTIGKMSVDGIDLSLQMLRDGAAWHEPLTISGQAATDASAYDETQQLAKTEKRGVWSVTGLKAPWQVRAEKDQQLRQIETARRITHPTLVGVSEYQSDIRNPGARRAGTIGISSRAEMNTWVSVFANAKKESYGLQTYSDPQQRFSAIYTSAILIDFASGVGKERLECRPMVISVKLYNGAHQNVFLIGFGAISEDYRFSKARSRLTALLDGKVLSLGAPRGWRGKGSIGAQEIMFYR